jgi:hypothetical protein
MKNNARMFSFKIASDADIVLYLAFKNTAKNIFFMMKAMGDSCETDKVNYLAFNEFREAIPFIVKVLNSNEKYKKFREAKNTFDLSVMLGNGVHDELSKDVMSFIREEFGNDRLESITKEYKKRMKYIPSAIENSVFIF